VASLLATAESISIGVRTLGGRTLEFRTSIIAETEQEFSVYVPAELWDRLALGMDVLIKASLPNGFILFETTVLALERKPIPHADLAAAEPDRMRRIPRREHFRISAVLPVTFTFERPGARIPEQIVTLTASTFDISSGGVGILIERAREKVLPAAHALGRLELTLASADPKAEKPAAAPTIISCEGRIARIEDIPNTQRVRLGVNFHRISEPQRMEVSRFVIAHQLALRRRGVIV
jgi:c-di-GMP-binding flagellar brake protein YcgR